MAYIPNQTVAVVAYYTHVHVLYCIIIYIHKHV